MVVFNKILPFKGFVAMNFFGIILFRIEYEIYATEHPKWFNKVKNHENIHTAQMKELLYVGFYLIYGIEYLVNLIKYRNADKAYRNIRFEIEAYRNEDNLNYLSERPKFAWRRYGKENDSTGRG